MTEGKGDVTHQRSQDCPGMQTRRAGGCLDALVAEGSLSCKDSSPPARSSPSISQHPHSEDHPDLPLP